MALHYEINKSCLKLKIFKFISECPHCKRSFASDRVDKHVEVSVHRKTESIATYTGYGHRTAPLYYPLPSYPVERGLFYYVRTYNIEFQKSKPQG